MKRKNSSKIVVKIPKSQSSIIRTLKKFSKVAEDFNSRFEKAHLIDESKLHKQVTI